MTSTTKQIMKYIHIDSVKHLLEFHFFQLNNPESLDLSFPTTGAEKLAVRFYVRHGDIEISHAQFHSSPDQAPKSVTTVITIAASTVVRFQDTEADVEIEVGLAASLVVKSSTESDIEHFVAANEEVVDNDIAGRVDMNNFKISHKEDTASNSSMISP